MADGYVFDYSDPEPTNLVAAPGDHDQPNLVELGTGCFAFCRPERGFGESNVGLLIDADGLTVIDTGSTPVRGKTVRAAIEELTAELDLPITRVLLTSSRVPFAGGSELFWRAGFYGSEATSDELDAPVNHVALQCLLPELAPAYHAGFTTRPVTHTIGEDAWLTASARAFPVPGESAINTVLHLPALDTMFLGAVGSFGVTPLAFVGDPAAWADALDRLAGEASTFVPGHGPVGGVGDLADLAGYLRACVAADGDPGAIGSGPWDGWTDRRFDTVNVERAAMLDRGDHGVPPSMFELLGLR